MGDLKIEQSQEGLQLKQDATKAYLFLFAIAFMLYKGCSLLLQMFPLENTGDYVGVVFITIWIAVILGMGWFVVGQYLFLRVVLNHNGVFCSKPFCKREILWCELKDYGISYEGRNKGGVQYCLYFSEEVLPEKKRNKKKLKGVVIQLNMDRNDYATVLAKVIPYCQQHVTATKPYIAE